MSYVWPNNGCPCYKNEKVSTSCYSQSQMYQSTFVGRSYISENSSLYRGTDISSGISFIKSNKLPSYSMIPGTFPTSRGKSAVTSVSNESQLCKNDQSQGQSFSYYNSLYMPYNQNYTCETLAAVCAESNRPMITEYQQPLQQQAYQPITEIHKPATNMCTLNQPVDPLLLSISSSRLIKCLPATVVPTNNCIFQDFTKSNKVLSFGEKACLPKLESLVDFDGEAIENETHCFASVKDVRDTVTLQITNLDYSLDELSLRSFLLNQLKPITPVVSLVFEGNAYVKVTVPDLYFAKQVVSNMHRKKIGHKRMLVSYTRDSSLTEVNTLRCQVAGLLKDVPYYTLPMYKFRELFQSRFKTSISVLDLYKMSDVCTITSDNNEDKFISLLPDLLNTIENSPLMEELQHSVPYCTMHFRREQHKGWAEQEIEPLPNVSMSISEIQSLVYPLLKLHTGDIPVATLLHCIEEQLDVKIIPNESGVNLEHLICCVQGIQIYANNFGIKILGWLELNKDRTLHSSTNLSTVSTGDHSGKGNYCKNSISDPLFQISREVIELIKMSPKSTMKFNRFIPAYHNHFGKQCRVADYGYTKLIELFEALSSVVQIMGDGENRQITLTHRTQIRRFTSDLLRVLRAHGNTSVLLSQLPGILSQTQNKNFDISDYGVCNIVDILDGLVNSNIVVISTVQNGKDILISMPKRKQTSNELEKTIVFAGEIVELLQNSLQYSILFQKFVRSYHYHFSYQCRLSDYGFLKLTDLMDAIHGLVQMEIVSDEEKKICLSPYVARRVFSEQCGDLINNATGNLRNAMKLDHVLKLHKKKFGYQMQAHTLGASDMIEAVKMLPYVEVKNTDQAIWIIYRKDDLSFRHFCYRACMHLIRSELLALSPNAGTGENTQIDVSSNENSKHISKVHFLNEFNSQNRYHLSDSILASMSHAIEIYKYADKECVRLTGLLKFLISIVRILEHRRKMHLIEIKTSLKCGLSTTFEFGFPNLYELLSAYEDLFSLDFGSSHDRCNVSLKANCELRLCNQLTNRDIFGSMKFTHTKKIDEFKSNENNLTSIVIPPISSEKSSFSSSNLSLMSSFGSGQGNSSFGDSLDFKENFFNSSLKLFNSSFNSSRDFNASLGAGDLTTIGPNTGMTDTSYVQSSGKLWRRRKVSSYQQPLQHIDTNIAHQKRKAANGLYDLVSSTKQLKGSLYGPPKADKSSDDRLPFWIDPIWSNRTEDPNPNIFNVRLPEIHSKNVIPMLLSPYTISKNENTKRKLLGMDNHDRNIA